MKIQGGFIFYWSALKNDFFYWSALKNDFFYWSALKNDLSVILHVNPLKKF